MTDELDLDAIEARHVAVNDDATEDWICNLCREFWPCDAAAVVAELRVARGVIRDLETRRDAALTIVDPHSVGGYRVEALADQVRAALSDSPTPEQDANERKSS